MALEDILLHQATVIRSVQGEKVQGEWRPEPVREILFDCVVFLPNTDMENRRGRRVEKPQMMYLPDYPDPPGGAVQLKVGDRVGIIAPEQNLAAGRDEDEELVWMVESSPQPLGKPGEDPVGVYVTIRRVEEG